MTDALNPLLELADRVEAATGPDRILDREIGLLSGWAQRCSPVWGIGAPHWFRDGQTGREIIGLAEGHEHGTLPYFTASLDAAMTLLYPAMPWLCPIIDYSERTVRLVNGLGLPVRGTDHRSRGETMPLALCASILRARAHTTRLDKVSQGTKP